MPTIPPPATQNMLGGVRTLADYISEVSERERRDDAERLTEIELCRAVDCMRQLGGSFASCIAEAFTVADSGNRTKLLRAFGDLFVRYLSLANLDRRTQACVPVDDGSEGGTPD